MKISLLIVRVLLTVAAVVMIASAVAHRGDLSMQITRAVCGAVLFATAEIIRDSCAARSKNPSP